MSFGVPGGVPGVDFGIEDLRGSFPAELAIAPLERPPRATVSVPGSKSVTNRALLVAALAEGVSEVGNVLFSDDSFYLMDSLRRLGFDLVADPDSSVVRIEGRAGEIPAPDADLFVGNAGTVARFLPPALALGSGSYRMDGVPRMRERPIEDLVSALRDLDVRVAYESEPGRFPINLSSAGLRGGSVTVDGTRSSQFASGLLLAAPYAAGPLEVSISGPQRSRPYVGITLEVMRAFGVAAEHDPALSRFHLEPAVYQSRKYRIEPDASAASYFFAAAAATGGRVRVPGLGRNTTQGDLRFVEVLERMGCSVETGEDHVTLTGPPPPQRLRGVEVDMNAFSDTMMTLAAIAPFADGPTTITNVEHTRYQETDRLSAVATELTRLGVGVKESRSGLRIIPKNSVSGISGGVGVSPISPATVRTYDDHRMAMAFAVAGLVGGGVVISDPACVTKTFPGYFQALEGLR